MDCTGLRRGWFHVEFWLLGAFLTSQLDARRRSGHIFEMQHAITFGDVLIWVGIPLALVALAAALLGILALFNPFRSGH